MAQIGLFLNGVYRDVLEDILKVQRWLPELVLYLQPYKKEPIKRFQANPPTLQRPTKLYLSTTDDLNTVQYVADVVGWEDKREVDKERLKYLNPLIFMFQPTEKEVYMTARGIECVNLLHVKSLKKLKKPFPIRDLKKESDDPPPGERKTAGGWSYVYELEEQYLNERV